MGIQLWREWLAVSFLLQWGAALEGESALCGLVVADFRRGRQPSSHMRGDFSLRGLPVYIIYTDFVYSVWRHSYIILYKREERGGGGDIYMYMAPTMFQKDQVHIAG